MKDAEKCTHRGVQWDASGHKCLECGKTWGHDAQPASAGAKPTPEQHASFMNKPLRVGETSSSSLSGPDRPDKYNCPDCGPSATPCPCVAFSSSQPALGPLCDNCGKPLREHSTTHHWCYISGEQRFHPSESRAGARAEKEEQHANRNGADSQGGAGAGRDQLSSQHCHSPEVAGQAGTAGESSRCISEFDDWVCSLAADHLGRHVAKFAGEIGATWPNERCVTTSASCVGKNCPLALLPAPVISVVPAVQVTSTEEVLVLRDPLNCVDGWIRNALYGDHCASKKYWSCPAKNQILLPPSEDGTEHWCLRVTK